MNDDDARRVELSAEYCTCGNPDPIDNHTSDCPMSLALEILEEVEALTP